MSVYGDCAFCDYAAEAETFDRAAANLIEHHLSAHPDQPCPLADARPDLRPDHYTQVHIGEFDRGGR